jgi:hypothetical protein
MKRGGSVKVPTGGRLCWFMELVDQRLLGDVLCERRLGLFLASLILWRLNLDK